MSYTALYRKWRPVSFEDVKGQDPIVQTLKNQITSERIGHAYLFCGTRGTSMQHPTMVWKTSVTSGNRYSTRLQRENTGFTSSMRSICYPSVHLMPF